MVNDERFGLTIIAANDKPLSKKQKAFNRLAQQIESLRREMDDETKRLDTLKREYCKKLPALTLKYARKQIEIVKLLGASAKSIAYGVRQKERLRAVILHLCDKAFVVTTPDEETKRIFDEWAEASYDKEMDRQREEMKEMFASDMQDVFGIDFDPSEFDDGPEGFARMKRRFEDEVERREQEREEARARRKKTPKQLEREAARKKLEEAKNRSIRSVYLSLAKALHPDRTSDAATKISREELMKKVTVAYAERDLPALLALEMEWVASEKGRIDSLADNVLDAYIAAMKEQAQVLQYELSMLWMHPRFSEVQHLSDLPHPLALRRIREDEAQYASLIRAFEDTITRCSRPNPKQTIMAFVRDYLKDVEFAARISDSW
jgi:hypothetical protein